MALLDLVYSSFNILAQKLNHLFLALALLSLLSACRFTFFYIKARSQFPGPPVRNFWIGNLDETMSDNIHEKWLQWNRKYGHIFQTWNGLFSRVIYIEDPNIIDKITASNWPKASTDHERWRIQRKCLSPAFQPHIIDLQYPCFSKHLTNFLHHLDTAAKDNTVVDFAQLHILLTLDFIGDIAYGTDLQAISQGPNCRILQLFGMVLPEMMKCGLFPLRARFPVLKTTRNMYRAIAELRSMADGAVENVRRREDVASDQRDGQGGKRSHKIFEILAEQREPDGNYTFSAKELRDNYVAFLVAGGDPTAHTMSFFIYEVLCHPEINAQLRAEIEANIPSDAFIPSLHQAKLPYLNMVLKETLRYHSTGFGTFRTCAEDVVVSGVTLPANTSLALWNPAVHRDPRLWEDPDSFDPERWRAGQPKARGSYFPFSSGPRNCIGQRLAMLEMTLTLATLFRRYDLSSEPGFKMEVLAGFTLRPKNGLPLRVVRRSS